MKALCIRSTDPVDRIDLAQSLGDKSTNVRTPRRKISPFGRLKKRRSGRVFPIFGANRISSLGAKRRHSYNYFVGTGDL